MKKKRGILGFSILFASIACLFGCSTLHVHDQDSPWAHSETEHWQVCTKCGKEFNKEKHTFDEIENKCHICEYHDPVFNIDENGIMTSLTTYGKTKTRVDPNWYSPEFRNVKLIGDHAFKDSKAETVVVPETTIGFNKNAFNGTQLEGKDPTPEKIGTVWKECGDYKLQEDLVEENDVIVNGTFYKTLQDALNSVREEDATITILKDLDYKNDLIKVKSNVTLSSASLLTEVSLKCSFEVESGKTLKILANRVKYSGTSYLPVGLIQEKHGKDQHECCTTGSIVFNGIDKDPSTTENKVLVYYKMDGKETLAVGAKQITTKALIFESENFAYGTLRFSKDFKQITGLTEFGQTVTGLTIHSVVDPSSSQVNEVSIVNSCFIRYGEEKITIKILWSKKEITISGNFQKGAFSSIVIGKGITSIGNDAFSTAFESSHMDQTLREAVSLVMCPLVTIEIGDDLKYINPGAFRFCGSLDKVYGGKSLERIGWAAFADCYKLTQVDFEEASNLQEITNCAFGSCNRLQYAGLPKENWVMGGKESYPVTECTPENFAFWLKTRHIGQNWNRNVSNQGCYTFNPNNRDQDGRHNNTKYTNNLQDAINNSGNDSIIHITKNYKNPGEIKNIEVKHTVRIIADEGVEVTIDGLSVNNYCCAIFEGKVNITGNVVLSKEGKNAGQGGVAIEKNVGTIEDNKVYTRVNKTGEPAYKSIQFNCKIPDLLTSKEKEYIGYGACDFTCDTSKNKEELIRLSNLGFRCSSIELKEQSDATTDVSIQHNFGTNNDGHNNLKNIEFGDNVRYIGVDAFKQSKQLETIKTGVHLQALDQGAFYECRNLHTADISKSEGLDRIGNGCFKDCKIENIETNTPTLNYIGQNAFLNNPLNSFYFHKDNLNDWAFQDVKGNKTRIFKEEIENANDAAKLLTGKYCGTGNWIHI